MSLKRCSRCKQQKPRSDFHINRAAKDGLNWHCKECQRTINQGDAHKRSYKKYAKTEKGKLAHKKAQRNYRKKEDTRAKIHKHEKKYRENNPDKILARNRVTREIVMGRMKSATSFECTKCNNKAVEYHHHKGYSKEHHLYVIPLCASCHLIEG